MQQSKLAGRISDMMRMYSPSQQVQQKLNQLSLLSDYQIKSQLDIPQLHMLFPSLFPNPKQNKKEIKEQKHQQVNKQQVVLFDLSQNQQQKQKTQKQKISQAPVQIDNQIQIKIDKQKYPNINIKVNSSIKVVDNVNNTIAIQEQQKVFQKINKSPVIPDQQIQKQDENQQIQQFLTLSSIHQYSNIDYIPIDDPKYVPRIQSNQQIQRLINAVVSNLDQDIQTNLRYQNMHSDYVGRGGLRNIQEFKQKIIEDLFYLSTLEIKKLKYRKQPQN